MLNKTKQKAGVHWHRNPDGAWTAYYGVPGELHLMVRLQRACLGDPWIAIDGDKEVVSQYNRLAYNTLTMAKLHVTEIVERKIAQALYALKWIDIAMLSRAGTTLRQGVKK